MVSRSARHFLLLMSFFVCVYGRSFVHMKKCTIKIQNNERVVQLPETWDDLGKRDLMLVYKTMFPSKVTEKIDHTLGVMKVASITKHLLGLDNAEMEQWRTDCIVNEDGEEGDSVFLSEFKEVAHLAIEGLFEIDEDEEGRTTYAVKFNRLKNPYPEIQFVQKQKGDRSKVIWFYGPHDGLSNITIYELGYAFTLFENYVAAGDEASVNELLAILYRPSKPRSKENTDTNYGGDRRMKLRGYEAKAEERALQMKEINPDVKRVILFWFASCRQAIIERYPSVFSRRSKMQDGDGSQYGWAGVLMGLAGGVAHLDAVSDQHHSNALTWLSIQSDNMP